MGKPKWKKSSHSRSGSGPSRVPKETSPSLANIVTVEGIVEKIQAYIESCDFNLAEKFAVRGIGRFPDNPEVLEVAAQCFTEVGHIQKARASYQKAIALSPLKGWRKYLALAQLYDGTEALLQYTRGIEVMEREIVEKVNQKQPAADTGTSTTNDMETSSDLPVESSAVADSAKRKDFPSPRDLSNAYLAVSELYTTDLCDEEAAEESCKYAIDRAMLADPKNPEPFLQMANFYLIKGEKDLAKEATKGGLTLWYKDGKIGKSARAKSSPAEEVTTGQPASASTSVQEEQDSDIPALSFQIETAKTLIECEEYDLAGQLFVEFISQNPSDPELWYLLGLSHILQGAEFYAQARSDFKKAKRFSVMPHGVCYDVIAQCDEHMSTIASVLPVDEADSDDEEESSVAGKTGNGKVDQAKTVVIAEANSDREEDSDWETDEEEEPGQADVEMS